MLTIGKKDILILVKGPSQGLDDTTLTAEKEYSINFNEQHKEFYLSLRYNCVNSYIFVNGVEIYKFKAKDSKITATPLCLGNVLKYFLVNNMKKSGLYRYIFDFSVNYDSIDVIDILNILKYLMKKKRYKLTFRFN